MIRVMYDAVTVKNVPATATLVAGYGDGYWNNIAAFKARFPHARVVEIAVRAEDDLGVVLDVETGDASPAQAPGWVKKRRAAGVDPTVYCNSSTWPAVKAAFKSAGVAEPHYWIAHYDGIATVPAGAVAKQYKDPGPYDLSVVATYWPGVDPKPVPAKPRVSLKNIIAAAHADPKGKQGHTTHPADVKIVEAALRAGKFLAAHYASDGSFGSLTVTAYADWQKTYSRAHKLGWTGSDVNGIPGKTSLTALGDEHGFTVVA